MTVCQLIEKLHGIAAIWDGDAEIRLIAADIGFNQARSRHFHLDRVTDYLPAAGEQPAIVDIAIRLWGGEK